MRETKELVRLRARVAELEGAGTPTHRHKKRGSEYVLLGFGRMQCGWLEIIGNGYRYPVDMREVAIYRSVDDGSLWVRPREEFEDGRFEALATQSQPRVADDGQPSTEGGMDGE